MIDANLTKVEYDTATNIVDSILGQSVDEITIVDKMPPINEMSDSNRVFKGKLSVLFVDMRKSTDLTDELKSKKMVKVYRSFIRIVVQAIRYSGGQSRQFAGDGVLGIFQDDIDVENPLTSSQKAVRAARYILTLVDYCLNPALNKHIEDVIIGCGIGISTGTIMATKIGMRGKEANEDADNELGIAWVGQTTNYASRLCGLARPREIFIDKSTSKALGESSDIWKAITRVKGNKSFSGFVAYEHYLTLPDDIAAERVIDESPTDREATFIQEIFDVTTDKTLSLVDEISKKSAELSKRLDDVAKTEQRLNNKESSLEKREENIDLLELKKIYNLKYNFLCVALNKCTTEQIRAFGKDYWLNYIKELNELSSKLGHEKVNGGKAWRYSQIYNAFQLYSEYFDEVCNMAKDGFTINEGEVQIVIDKTPYRSLLKNALNGYIEKNPNCETSDNYKKLVKKLEG